MAKSENNQPSWSFHNDQAESGPAPSTAGSAVKPVSWTASEFIEHDKSASWFLILAVAAATLAGLVYLFTKDVTSVVMIIIAAIAFGIFAARKPRVLEYEVDGSGVKIAEKFYPYSSFKAFAVVNEGAVESVWLMPLRRFMPILTIYFAPNDGQKIVNVISNFLPFQDHQPDPVDRLIQRIRF